MQSTNYELSARSKQVLERPRLFSGWALAGFAVVVLIPLLLIFPKQELMRQASQQRLGDVLTINYLSNLLKTDPDNLELRLLLAEHLIFIGELEGVPALYKPAQDSQFPIWQTKGLLTEYKYLTKQMLLSEKGSLQQQELNESRHTVFLRLSWRPWPIPTLVYLAEQADQLHERKISSLLYRDISELSNPVPVDWFTQTAARVLGEGDYELAAHLYFVARHKDGSLSNQREYFLAGIHALMSASLFDQTMQAIDQNLGNLQDDRDTLYALIQAARAANDQPRAVRYAKQLLHISRLEKTLDWLPQFALALIGITSANAASSEQPQASSDVMRPYDQKSFQLTYDVFVGNHNLIEAFHVAEAAVRQSPAETIWHKRLAQVAEWINKPEVALREWRWLVRNGGGQEALLAVLRLAPSLNNYDALLDAWQGVAARQHMDEAKWNNLSNLFEQTGRQREGIKFFEQRYVVDHLPLQLEIAARLAERMGDEEHASALYFQLLKQFGFNSGWLMNIANLYLRKGEYQKTYDLLQKYRANIDEKNVAYFKLLADLAWQLQRDSDATKSYSHLAETGNLEREDFSRLIYLLGDSRQEEQAALAELAYRRFGDRDMLLQALEIYTLKRDMPAQKRLFDSIASDPNVDFSDSSRFYQLRAQYFLENGAFQAARADFRHAVGLAPNDSNTINATLWFLINAHDVAALREMVSQIIARGDNQDPAIWGTLAAAYQTLEQPSLAVLYYTKQLKRQGQDFLWLVNYADALEQNHQARMAAQVRRHVWLQLQTNLSGKPVTLPFSQDMLAAARLAILNYPDDPGLTLVRTVLRQDRLIDRDIVVDDLTNELVLGWAISKEQSSNAKAWLWRRYGQSLNTPVWAEAAVAVAENDTEQIDKLLAEQSEGMSMLIRHDAANALDQTNNAQTIAFNGLTNSPENNEAHLRLTEDVLPNASFINFEIRSEQIGSLHRITQEAQIEMPVAHHLRLAAELWNANQANYIPPVFGNVPPNERVAGLVLKNHDSGGDTEIAVRRRNEFSNTTESHVKHEANILPRINLQLGAEFNAPATESNDLQVFGMRDEAGAGIVYTISKREYLHVESGWARYYTQTGDFLGSGSHFSWDLGHQFRTEYPDWGGRLFGIHTHFNETENAALTLPDNSNIYGVCFGFGKLYQSLYTQAWRPHIESCATHNTLSGQGYNTMMGFAGSVAGHDQLSLTLRQERGAANLVNGLTRVLNINYKYFYN